MTQSGKCARFGIIMAGGAGERFWPLSRANLPKQLLALTHPTKSMLHEAVERMAPVIPPDRLFVITGRHLTEAIRDAKIGLPAENILAEPCKRNTSGALAYATACLMARNPGLAPDGMSLAITTADHRIGDDETFRRAVVSALSSAEQHDALVVCGIAPSRPDTGFGYIQIAQVAHPLPGCDPSAPVFDVQAFREKPCADTAAGYVASGTFLWNSGMFFWRVSTFLDELSRARPALRRAIEVMTEALRRNDEPQAGEIFQGLDDISIDYALMEHATRVLAVRGDFPWDDVGSWPSLARERGDAAGNALFGEPIVRDCTGCVVYNAPGPEKMAVGVVGMKDVVVVATEDAVLVLPAARSQDVRHIVQELRRQNRLQV